MRSSNKNVLRYLLDVLVILVSIVIVSAVIVMRVAKASDIIMMNFLNVFTRKQNRTLREAVQEVTKRVSRLQFGEK